MGKNLVIYFFWEGLISSRRLELLQNCLYSTSAYNPTHDVRLVSNSLSQDQFDPRYQICVTPWDRSSFDGIPVSDEIIDKYVNADKRTLSDFFRLVLLYKHGGSWCDTDDLCIGPITESPNMICRSYDSHTAYYNRIKDEDCIPGTQREIRGYDDIPIFPRNDCLMNFEPNSPFIHRLFTHPDFVNAQHPLNILGGISFQSHIQTVIKEGQTPYTLGLVLLTLYESFMASSCSWDYKEGRGELHDLYDTLLPDLDKCPWGSYTCNRHIARDFMFQILKQYPHCSHLWLHGKEDMGGLFERPDPESVQLLSTWIYWYNVDYARLLV